MSWPGPAVTRLLRAADRAVAGPWERADGPLRVGVDLGTSCVVIFVVDHRGVPVAGSYRWADVVRDGVVLDYAGTVALVRELRAEVEERVGRELETAAVSIPPSVPVADSRAHRYVVEAAGLDCTAVVEEPVAANAVLGIRNGAIVDVGGGTTGIAVVRDGQVVTTVDEPTGGTHVSLVVAGAHRIPYDEAEQLKRDPARHRELMPVVRPVLDKIGTIVARSIAGHHVEAIYLVGGTSAFEGIAGVVQEVTGIPTSVPDNPLFVTPLGVALHDESPALAGTGTGG